MIKGASPILNGLYTPFVSPVPGGQKPQKGTNGRCSAIAEESNGLTNLLLGGLAAMFKIVRLIFFALIVQLRISRRIVINAIED